MKTSTDRILTTHVGSLPRSKAVTEGVFARENEQPYDTDSFAATLTAAVDEVVAKQVRVGVDVVSDGEMSKISYATYIKDRVTGFAGDSKRNASSGARPARGAHRATAAPVVWRRLPSRTWRR